MREILFRGKRFDGGGWIYGDLMRSFCEEDGQMKLNSFKILTFDLGIAYPVLSFTIGQYTGLTDKNGKRIFEGDVFLHNNEYLYEVIWNDEQKGFYASGIDFLDDDCMGNFYESNIEVIGNIQDNPELIAEAEGC